MVLTENEYRVFKQAIQDYFKKKKKPIVFKDDYTLEIQKDSPIQETYFLTNIAKICKREKKEKWSEIITDFYERFQKSKSISLDLKKRKEDFEYYKKFIGVRFYHKDYFSKNDLGKHFLYLPILEDAYLALIIDFPDHVKNLDPKLNVKWNKSEKELFLLGITNIREKYQYEIKKEIIGRIPIYVVSASHFFSSIILLELSNYNELVGKYGSLICIPNRHETFIYPINGIEVKDAIECLIRVIKNRYEEPGSISKNMYWFKNNDFTLQELTFEGNNVFVRLSKEFREVIKDIKTSSSLNNP